MYKYFTMKILFFSFDPKDIFQGFIATDLNHDGILTLDEYHEISRQLDINGKHSILLPDVFIFLQNVGKWQIV